MFSLNVRMPHGSREINKFIIIIIRGQDFTFYKLQYWVKIQLKKFYIKTLKKPKRLYNGAQ